MTPEQFRERMAAIENGGVYDCEDAHVDADALMCEALRELGYGDGVDIFQSLDKWYA